MDFIDKLNRKGIPVPLFRDPKTGVASITFSLFLISGLLCAGCSVIAIAGALSKAAGIFKSFTDAEQSVMNSFSMSFQFFMGSGGFYLGRRFQRDGKGAIDVSSKDDENGKKQKQDIPSQPSESGNDP